MHSTACTTLNWCWCVMWSAATSHAAVHSLVCHQVCTHVHVRACLPATVFVGLTAVCKTDITYRQTDQQRDRHISTGGTLLFLTPTSTTVGAFTAAVSSATTTPDMICLSVCQLVHSATCWLANLPVSDWLSEMRVCVCRAAGARGLANGWRGMGRAEPPMLSAPRSGFYRVRRLSTRKRQSVAHCCCHRHRRKGRCSV